MNERDIFFDFLKKKELKLTAQREEILKYFLMTERHVSVEDLYEIVKKKNPGIGLATVFRTLKLLSRAGIAAEVDFGDKVIRYEHKFGHRHHDHLVCLECGAFFEAMDPRIEKLQEKLCGRFGFVPRYHKMEIFGMCKLCAEKAKKRQAVSP